MLSTLIFGFICLGLLLLFPVQAATACSSALTVWAVSVVPSLFPFIAVCCLLTGSGALQTLRSPVMRAFRLPEWTLGIALTGCVSGYPAGARLSESVCLSKGERLRLLTLCSTASPMFTVGTVASGMLGSKLCGWIMYGCSLLSGAIVAFALGRFASPPQSRQTPEPPAPASGGLAARAIWDAAATLLKVGGYIAAFYTLYAIIGTLLSPIFSSSLSRALFAVLFETTMGCRELAALELSLTLRSALCTFSLCFGGGCVAAQVTGLCGVSAAEYMLTKLVQAALGAALCFLLLPAVTSCFAG